MYRWMLSTDIKYAVRRTDIRRQNEKKIHIMSPLSHMTRPGKAEEKSTDKKMISLLAKLRTYILGTVRISMLHVIMMIRMTLSVVPNVNRIADNGNL